jgi:4'-phosphopantetheinyl transferase
MSRQSFARRCGHRWYHPTQAPWLDTVPVVDVRIARLDVDPAEASRLAQHLAPDERERAGRFHFERDRRRFVARRGLLREWLAEVVNDRPERLTFTWGDWGKPALRDHSCCFNLSHSDERLMVAFSDAEIGCDIERIDDHVDWLPVAEQFLRPRDLEHLRILAPAHARSAFFRLWTGLEASLKADGRGLCHSYPIAGSSGAAAWHLTNLDVEPGYAAAIAAAKDLTALQLTVRYA